MKLRAAKENNLVSRVHLLFSSPEEDGPWERSFEKDLLLPCPLTVESYFNWNIGVDVQSLPNITSETMSLFKETWKTVRPTIKERNMFMFNNDLCSNVTFFCLRGGLQNLLPQQHADYARELQSEPERKKNLSCTLFLLINFSGSIFKFSHHHHPRAKGHAN